MQETWVWSLDWEDPPEKGKATHSSVLAWRVPRTVYSPWGCNESPYTTERLSLSLFEFGGIDSFRLFPHGRNSPELSNGASALQLVRPYPAILSLTVFSLSFWITSYRWQDELWCSWYGVENLFGGESNWCVILPSLLLLTTTKLNVNPFFCSFWPFPSEHLSCPYSLQLLLYSVLSLLKSCLELSSYLFLFESYPAIISDCIPISLKCFLMIFLSYLVFLHQFYILVLVLPLFSDQIRSVAQSCPTLCDPINCSTPGLPVHHQLPEFTEIHVHRVSDAIQPSHPLSSPSPPAPNPSQHQGLFQWVSSSHEVAKV